jgi:hypothetical protein
MKSSRKIVDNAHLKLSVRRQLELLVIHSSLTTSQDFLFAVPA